jgi:hypothetical protein
MLIALNYALCLIIPMSGIIFGFASVSKISGGYDEQIQFRTEPLLHTIVSIFLSDDILY